MGQALAEALAGDVSPAGRSPYTWPTGMSQVPDELLMSPTAPPGRTYRHLTLTPLFSFGFGLSYGSFSYSAAEANPPSVSSTAPLDTKVEVCVMLTNAATARASEEVVEVFADPGPAVATAAAKPPRALLAGFQRTRVIAPGDTATKVCVEFPLRHLRLAAKAESGPASFRLLPGAWTLTIGGRGGWPQGVNVDPVVVPPPLELPFVVRQASDV